MGNGSSLISPELRERYNQMPFGYKLMLLYVNIGDRHFKWYKLPVFMGLLYLEFRRTVHQKYNLIAVGPYTENTGDEGAFIGRNMEQAPAKSVAELLDPHPAVVATKLLNRKEFVGTGKQFNMLAASWINFMIHDWIDHEEDTNNLQGVKLSAPESVASQCPLQSFKFYPSKEYDVGKGKVGYKNTRSSWWDASMIYGTNEVNRASVRTFVDGKLKIYKDELLTVDKDGIPLIGDPRNPWMGVAVLQALFVSEHNLICDKLKAAYPTLNDEALYTYAKVTNQAILAKIHTIDWTVELLKMNTLLAGMRANWYGLLGKAFKDKVGNTGNVLLSGIVGQSKAIDHGVPYSLTEEFTSVYRMHPLLPETIFIRDIQAAPIRGSNEPQLLEEVPVKEFVGIEGIKKARKHGIKTLLTSLGHQASGALTLFNYPNWMRDLPVTDTHGQPRKEPVDMQALEIYRDRERFVNRYNQFRRSLFMPEIKSLKDLTDDADTIKVLREVYGDDVEKIDTLVGLLAEKKIPGYAISETAFYVFLLMASRRLEATPNFTSNFNAGTYTEVGLKWVNTTESLKDVISRHHPDIVKTWMTADSAFSVWSAPPENRSSFPPLYLRLP
ncbi:hypothetical protein R1sor_026699 [Riccia sorocarpa]|uniref:Uncharacterized protein n=1 Tax=Riccia sorocarpa TaxID=122646 RepID=A0ABD3GFT7_9MARC